jgi:hypothetical protein
VLTTSRLALAVTVQLWSNFEQLGQIWSNVLLLVTAALMDGCICIGPDIPTEDLAAGTELNSIHAITCYSVLMCICAGVCTS